MATACVRSGPPGSPGRYYPTMQTVKRYSTSLCLLGIRGPYKDTIIRINVNTCHMHPAKLFTPGVAVKHSLAVITYPSRIGKRTKIDPAKTLAPYKASHSIVTHRHTAAISTKIHPPQIFTPGIPCCIASQRVYRSTQANHRDSKCQQDPNYHKIPLGQAKCTHKTNYTVKLMLNLIA